MKAVTAVIIALRDMPAEHHIDQTSNWRELQWQRHDQPALGKPLFNWNAKDRYIELQNWVIEEINILETKAYELPGEEKAPMIKKFLDG